MFDSPAPEAKLEDSAARFITYLHDVRRLSPHTISNYKRDLLSLQHYCEKSNKDAIESLVEADIRAWASQLHRRGLAGGSIQRSLSATRSYYNFLGRENGVLRNPATSVQAPRKPRKLPKTLDADQVRQISSVRLRHSTRASRQRYGGIILLLGTASGRISRGKYQ